MLIKKLPKKFKDPEDLLYWADLVDKEANQAYPGRIYISKKDYVELKRKYKKALRKKYPYISPRKLESSVEMHFLNLGPNQSLETVLKPGYAVIYERE